MPSIMNDESGRLAWLHCNTMNKLHDKQVECGCQLFDRTPFTIVVSESKVKYNKDNKSGWVQVVRHGSADHTVSVTLPAPATRYGSRVRVGERQLDESV
jgi:hypothetical protein